MYINREAMKDNIFEVHQHVLDELRDELLNKMKQLSSDNNEFNHKNITLVLDSYIKKIYKICPYINKSEIYEPYLENYIKFITVVILYTELNTYGYTYPEFIFNTFKEYLWGDKLNISFDQINSCINSEFSTIFDEVNSYGNIINKRRKKNLSNNKFYEVEKKTYKSDYSYGSKNGEPGKTYKPLRMEKRFEFEMITILTILNQTQNTMKLQAAIDGFTFNRYESIGIELSKQQLSSIRETYRKIDWRKPITYNEFFTMHKFMYDYYNNFSDFKALDMHALEKRFCFQSINAIIKTWRFYASLGEEVVNVTDDFMIETTKIVLSLPSFSLRLKHLQELNKTMINQKRISIASLQKRTSDLLFCISMKASYTIDTVLQVLESPKTDCSSAQYDILLNSLKKLIDIYSDKFTLSTNEIPIDNMTETIFQKIYKNLYPPRPPQKRAKRKPDHKKT